jgi:hypothetical protein
MKNSYKLSARTQIFKPKTKPKATLHENAGNGHSGDNLESFAPV